MQPFEHKSKDERENANDKKVLDTALNRARNAFEGKYRQEVKDLLGLSEIEIQAAGLGLDPDIHETLISVVMDASRLNIPEGELKYRIEALGEDAVRIARLVPSLNRFI